MKFSIEVTTKPHTGYQLLAHSEPEDGTSGRYKRFAVATWIVAEPTVETVQEEIDAFVDMLETAYELEQNLQSRVLRNSSKVG